MTKKTYALSCATALTLALAVFISGFVGRSTASASSSALSALPASDIVLTVDTQRLLSETLPTISADNPGLLAKVNEKIEKFKKETNVDLRTFDSLAVGLRFKSGSSDDFDAVMIARGHFNSNEVIDAGFAAAAAKHKNEFQKREEQYEGKTIFVIVPQRHASLTLKSGGADDDKHSGEAVLETKTDSPPSQPAPDVKVTSTLRAGAGGVKSPEQMAIVALDANTLAVGNLQSVRAAIDASLGRGRVDDALVQMATQNASALVGFSGRFPASITEKAASGRGPEAKYIASIREFYGSFSTVGTDGETLIAVRTEKASEAQDIGQALNALKLLGSFSAMQPSKGEHSLGEILKDLSITTQGNEVQIKLRVNQKVAAPFMRKLIIGTSANSH